MVGDTRETIREVAMELFATRGFDQTSLREIAERVGLTKASLYYHFPSKQALLTAIVAPVIDGWRTIADDIEDMPHSPANARAVLSRSLEVLLRNRTVAGIFLHDPAGVVAAAGPMWHDLIGNSTRLTTWLAGPAPTMADRLRAIAAMEVLGAALSS
ncbi:TetR/AcrR family transcriptional regulator, partial [Actinophytocola sp.]|uniref:TetR/AcrR family transcriptional regulator n=1 Tax=Actinophytocola sp. TaxID=1872138 RepID=UPI0025BFE31A